jgi:cullin-associated NEDD8-dissociated protein 1
LELLTLRCPTEITPFLPELITAGTTYIKYDPNYAEDEDEPMIEADDEDEDDEDAADEYSDDEDTSYKIRKSATKLLAAVISTHPAMLAEFYKSVAPVLASRFVIPTPSLDLG